MQLATELKPVSLIGFGDGAEGAAFTGINPATGSALEPKFFSASAADLERAATLAQSAFPTYSNLSGKAKGKLLAPKTATGPRGLCMERIEGLGRGLRLGSAESMRASSQEPSSTNSAKSLSWPQVLPTSPCSRASGSAVSRLAR